MVVGKDSNSMTTWPKTFIGGMVLNDCLWLDPLLLNLRDYLCVITPLFFSSYHVHFKRVFLYDDVLDQFRVGVSFSYLYRYSFWGNKHIHDTYNNSSFV